jgi:AraC-like DNA-binding protein
MVLYQHVPPAPLSAFVRCFWCSEGAPDAHAKERLMPNGEPTIVFNLRDDEMRIYDADDLSRYSTYRHAVISGARTGCFVIDTVQEDRVFGIQFLPGGSFPFFREPASEIANQSTDLACLWGRAANELRERLLSVSNRNGMFQVAEQFLLRQLVRPLELHPAVSFAREKFSKRHTVSMASLAHEIGLSQRRFIELFVAQIGLPPKAFYRVRRFQRILEMVHASRDVEWVQVALDSGYYDQAHFNHDFREFSGLTPSQYVARATQHLNHVPVL